MDVVHVIDDELDDLDIIDFIENGLPRQVYIRHDHFHSFDDVQFRRRFRLSRGCTLNLLQQIEHHLEYPFDVNNSVSPMNQLLTCLRFYSTGGHLQSVADFAGMHVSTVSRIIVRVSEAIASLCNNYITFPATEQSRRHMQRHFFHVAQFPRVVGAVDCTHIKIESPGGDDSEVFRNRKGYFSLNVQMICNAHFKILNVVARWPGSAHDTTILNNSRICVEFENGNYRNSLLLGDSGYPCRTYLFTPILNPVTAAEQAYNESHIQTRNTIERCFGVLKRRFPVISYGARVKLNTTMTIIVAASVLHNIAIEANDVDAPPIPEEINGQQLENLIENDQVPPLMNNNNNADIGFELRRNFINEYFGNLQ